MLTGFTSTRCGHCAQFSMWLEKTLVSPAIIAVSRAHSELPSDCKDDYEEARVVLSASPRSSAALLRLVIQKLMRHLGQPGKNINEDIAALVRGGLPERIQQSLDVCRIVGNEAVHPGEMDLNATPELAAALFDLINVIVENRIAEPKRIEALYNGLPQGKLKGVEERDK